MAVCTRRPVPGSPVAEQSLTQPAVMATATALRPTPLRKVCEDCPPGGVWPLPAPASTFLLDPIEEDMDVQASQADGRGTRKEGRKEADVQPGQGHSKVADGTGTQRAPLPWRRETASRRLTDRL